MFLAENSSLEQCNDYDLAKQVTTWLVNFIGFERESWLQKCPIPCTQTTHQLTIAKFHKYSVIDQEVVSSFEDKGAVFYMNYERFTIEKNVEILRYDLVDFLTQAGGNLGLFLGCSCFSVLISGVELFRSLKF